MYEKLFSFKYSNKVEFLTIAQARLLNIPEINLRIEEIVLNSKSKRMRKDGFEPGMQDNIKEYCGSRGEYDRRLRELNLVEIGYDAVPIDTTTTTDHTANIGFALHARELGVDLTDNEIEGIADGSLLKDVILE